MPRVFVVNRGPYDYSEAERFGELVYCTHGKLNKTEISQMYRELADAMYDSSPEDYILLTSLTSLCSVACAIFGHRHGRLNLLIHHDGAYIAKKIVLE